MTFPLLPQPCRALQGSLHGMSSGNAAGERGVVRPDPLDKGPEELFGEAGPRWMLPFSPLVGAF